LSLRDARLFIIALCRLPKKDQKKILSKIVSVLNSGLVSVKEGGKLGRASFTPSSFHEEIASFIARVITLTSAAVDAVAAGKGHQELLSREIGETHYHLPSFIDASERNDDFELNESDWYKRESCYMGILSDWESAVLPLQRLNDPIKPLSDVDVSKFSSSLELALDLGFELARSDRCHLVFAAWNASSKISGWDSKDWSGPMSVADFNKCGNALKLINLRNDICQLHWEFDDDEKSVPNSFLTKLLKEKKRRGGLTMKNSYLNRIGFLLKGLPESLKMLECLNKNVCDLGDTQTSSGDFTTIEATLAYNSFFISMFTKSNSDFISSMLRRVKDCRRKRKGSSISAESLDEGAMEDDVSDDSGESESGCPDDFEDEDDAEAKLDGISRLHDACTSIGAAPLHPDWLDTNCQLRQRIPQSTAMDMTENAISILSDFGLLSFSKFKSALQRALSSSNERKDKSDQVDKSLALPLIILSGIQDSDNNTSADETLWRNVLVGVCNMDEKSFQVVLDEFPCKNASSAKDSFIPNSSHRIRGKLQDCGSLADGLSSTMSKYRA